MNILEYWGKPRLSCDEHVTSKSNKQVRTLQVLSLYGHKIVCHNVLINLLSHTVHRKYLVEEKSANLANCELFALPIFTDTPKMYLAYALTSLFAKFFLASNFYLYGSPKFPVPNISYVR